MRLIPKIFTRDKWDDEKYVDSKIDDDAEVYFKASPRLQQKFAKEVLLHANQDLSERVFATLSDEIRNDKKFLHEVLQMNEHYFDFLSSEQQRDVNVCVNACLNKNFDISKIHSSFFENRNFVMTVCSHDLLQMKKFQHMVDKEFLEEFVENLENNYTFGDKDHFLGMVFQLTPDSLKQDKDVIELLIRNAEVAEDRLAADIPNRDALIAKYHNPAYLYINGNEDFRADKQAFLDAFTIDHETIFHTPDSFRDDAELMIVAISEHPQSYSLVSDRLQQDKAFNIDLAEAMERIQSDYSLLSQVPAKFRKDDDFCKEVVHLNPASYAHAPDSVRNDPELTYFAFRDSSVLHDYVLKPESIGSKLLADKAFVMKFMDGISTVGESIFAHASKELRNDPEVATVALNNNLLRNLGDKLKNDVGFCTKILNHDFSLISEVGESIWRNKELIEKIANSDDSPPRLNLDKLTEAQRSEEHLVTIALKSKPDNLKHVRGHLAEDEEYLKKTMGEVDFYQSAYAWCDKFKDNNELAAKAMVYDPSNFPYLSDSLRSDRTIVELAVERIRADNDNFTPEKLYDALGIDLKEEMKGARDPIKYFNTKDLAGKLDSELSHKTDEKFKGLQQELAQKAQVRGQTRSGKLKI